jgi:bla regulator protein blaR1
VTALCTFERAAQRPNPSKILVFVAATLLTTIVPAGYGQGNAQQNVQATAQAPSAQQTVPGWQTAAGGRLSFEVASVRLSAPNAPPSENSFQINAQDDFSPTGGFFRSSAHLIMYIIFAYKIVDTSQYGSLLAQLPKWGNTDQFVIEARAEGNPTKNQYRLMMQSLLADRFKLAIHTGTRQLPVYAVILSESGKPGPQLRTHADDIPCPDEPAAAAPSAPNSAPLPYCGVVQGWQPVAGQQHMRMVNVNMEQIAAYLSEMAYGLGGFGEMGNRPIIDQTGLSGKFDFDMEFALPKPAPLPGTDLLPDAPGLTFVNALRKQLGLKLVKQIGPVNVFVIDHVEPPSEN